MLGYQLTGTQYVFIERIKDYIVKWKKCKVQSSTYFVGRKHGCTCTVFIHIHALMHIILLES